MRSLRVIATLAVAALACCKPEIPEGVYACVDDGDCPPEMFCRVDDGHCFRSRGELVNPITAEDGSVRADGDPDAASKPPSGDGDADGDDIPPDDCAADPPPRCNGAGIPEHCGPQGEWVVGKPCELPTPVCEAGACAACKTGATGCESDGVTPRVCESGEWVAGEPCDEQAPACLQATGTCGNCRTGDAQCGDAATPQLCKDGAWMNQSPCADGTVCLAGACAQCDPDGGPARRCQEGEPQVCSPEGNWVDDAPCRGQTPVCNSSTQTCTCEEGALRCGNPETLQRCNDAGQWVAEACPDATPTCANSECVLVTPCAPGEKRSCAEANLMGPCALGTQTCGEDGQWGKCSIPPEGTDRCETPQDDGNCNGIPNEGCPCLQGDTRPCSSDRRAGAVYRGDCATGTQRCMEVADGKYDWEQSCSIMPAQAEADGCDASGDDADCDGTPNEGCDCIRGKTQTCDQGGLYGKCASGKQACSAAGKWGPCDIKPSASDTCEPGNDDNCNGKQNDGSCPCLSGDTRKCSAGGFLGPCSGGNQTCRDDGTWGPCSIRPAAADACVPGDDADCDGTPNEGCTCLDGTTRKCGPCLDGTETCTDGKAGSYGACKGATPLTMYYRDADSDGYGDPGDVVEVCGAAPSGYVAPQAQNDCCDTDASTHPGEGWAFCYVTQTSLCGGHDVNCDGREDDCETWADCGGWQAPVPACGEKGTLCAPLGKARLPCGECIEQILRVCY